jgi:hypothetical protein
MDKDLRKKVEERVEAKTTFITTAVTFLGISLVLGLLSLYLPSISFWLLLPLPIFAMILGILYVQTYGYNFSGSPSLDWKEREIEKEMYRLSQGTESTDPDYSDDLSHEDHLELRELDRLQRKWGTRDEDFV